MNNGKNLLNNLRKVWSEKCLLNLFFLAVVLLLTLLGHFIVGVRSDCTLLYKRSSRMTLKQVNHFLGDRLYDIRCFNQISQMASATRCIKMENCYYLTVDKTNNVCTFYNQGSTIYNTANLLTYALEVPSTAVNI